VADAPVIAAEHTVHLDTVEFEGHRYVAAGDLGLGRPVPLMVHGNARVYLSLVHAVAEQLLGQPVPKLEDYGYTTRGRGSIDVPQMRLGDAAFDGLDDVPVFDFSDAPDAPVQGMLGTRFLMSAHAAVDFSSDSLLLGVTATEEPDPGLLARGFRVVPTVDLPDGRMTLDVVFPALGRAVPITLSTVANALTLHRPLLEGMVAMRAAGLDHSPSGTTPDVFTSEGVAFEVAGAAFETTASLQDLAEYANVAEAELQAYGMLGFDWMHARRAVLDFANRRCYFRQSS
jgi:hypothetical protein